MAQDNINKLMEWNAFMHARRGSDALVSGVDGSEGKLRVE